MAGAFGSFFDTQQNQFGIDFVAVENNVFGIDPFPFAPPPSVPSPIANYDFNFYTASDPTIANQIVGSSIGDATIHEQFSNTFVDVDPTNKYLTIYAPNGADPTGGMTTPSIASVYSAEMWVRMDVNDPYGMYFVDFRTGLAGGFIIGAGGGGDGAVGSDWVGQKMYYNTIGEAITAVTNPVTTLYNNGWFQVVLVSSTPFTDDMSFFCRFTAQQGMPLSVADVYVYDVELTSADVIALYNAKCSRYGLLPI